jgi:hypothetical protein
MMFESLIATFQSACGSQPRRSQQVLTTLHEPDDEMEKTSGVSALPSSSAVAGAAMLLLAARSAVTCKRIWLSLA